MNHLHTSSRLLDRISCLFGALALAAFSSTGCGNSQVGAREAVSGRGTASEAPQPDVLVLCIDGWGPEALTLSPEGRAARVATLPTLDALALDSVVYRDTLSTSPWSGETMQSVLSALTPDRSRRDDADGSPGKTPPEEPWRPSFVEVLRQHGYSTSFIAAHPLHVSSFGANSFGAGGRSAPGFDVSAFAEGALDEGGASANDVAAHVIVEITEKDAPALIVATFADPRPPHTLAEQHAGEWAQNESVRELSGLSHAELLRRAPDLTGEQIAHIELIHATELAAVDAAIERILSAAEGRRAVPPVVCVLGLRRPALGAGGRFGLLPSLSPEALRVPLMIRFPASTSTIERPIGVASVRTSLADTGPTLLDCLGFVPRLDVDGRSVFPGASQEERILVASTRRGIRGHTRIELDAAQVMLVGSDGVHEEQYEWNPAESVGAGGEWRTVPTSAERSGD